jgi:hypothetical protein
MSSVYKWPRPSKRQAVESWIKDLKLTIIPLVSRRPENARLTAWQRLLYRSSVTTEKNKLAAPALTRKALIQLVPSSTLATQPQQLLDDDLTDRSSQATDSEDQSEVHTPCTITPELPAFERELRRRKVLDAEAEEMAEQFPDNWEEIEKILVQDRESQEPTASEHKGFRRRVINSGNAAVMASVCPKFLQGVITWGGMTT